MSEKLILVRKKRNLDTGSEVVRIKPRSKMKLDDVTDKTGLTNAQALAKIIDWVCDRIEYVDWD